jgi:acyl-coenzyme A synthetase/AMP-(fatty) acid ligase
MAFVILREGFRASEELARLLRDHVAKKTAPFKAPRFIEFVDSLPRSDRDKLSRKELKRMAEAAAERQKEKQGGGE